MKKKYFLFAGIIWLVLMGAGLYFYNKPHTSAAGLSADFSVDAVDLFRQYQKDEQAADKQFLNKIIEIKGRVADAQQTTVGANIELDGGNAAGGINCSISTGSQFQLPAKGSVVTIKGRCSGFLMDVNMVDCVIE